MPLSRRSFTAGKTGARAKRAVNQNNEPSPSTALRADLSAHQFDQPFGDRESQPRAAEAPRCQPVGLRERFEQLRQHGRSDADPGVLDLETQHDVAAKNLERNDPRDDAAAFGEFHRVAQQVQQDLTQPVGVAFDAAE